MKKLIVVAVAIAISMGLVASSSAAVNSVGDPGRSWAQPNDAELGQHIQQFIDTVPNEVASYLIIDNGTGNYIDDPTCQSHSDEKCVGKSLIYSSVIPYCVSINDLNCISDFGILSSTGEKTSAKFFRYFPTHAQNEFSGDQSLGLPSGVAGSIYELPAAMHDGGTKYFLSVKLSGWITAKREVSKPELEIKLTPIDLEKSGYFSSSNEQRNAGWAKITDKNTGETRWGQQGAGYSGDQFCVANSWQEKLCAQKYAFPADFRFYVALRTSKNPGGWMHGRISSPEINITKMDGYNLIEFYGNPVAVPTVYKMYKYLEMPDLLKSNYDVVKGGYINSPWCKTTSTYCTGGRSGPSPDPLNRNVISSPEPWTTEGMEQLKLWLPYVNDKATALPSFWSVRTLSANEMSGASQCFSDTSKITGIVTTNSTQYSAGPPAFDKSEGTLGYQVASPHYGTTGDVFKGSYDLVMRSEVARCVYGFSKAPIQASLSITSADGSPQIATTVMGERNGWLYLSAKNFEFSAPVIKAKLSQEAATPSPEVSAPAVAKKVTITCAKGKAKKRVTGFKPVCPKGYKKVA